ncbi:ALQxL family class IV lanthipeptide [Streptomyces coffeae]|uniref:ALQxL family class IV lanthipeptide n=1 Tax=Streptomyces coffeae TaxID=621382 RepID=A0ABS1NLS9_9ACTN|nr:ALQxL family class IV lanthipeptide [Streptomyces coffeae]MBL1101059.1 ALQxL family class IV lanthipeptide [Streptomyces coffeae]
MTLDVASLQELEATEEPGLGGCPILGSCCNPGASLPSVLTCFGCTFFTN